METELNHLTANMAALESENNKLRAELEYEKCESQRRHDVWKTTDRAYTSTLIELNKRDEELAELRAREVSAAFKSGDVTRANAALRAATNGHLGVKPAAVPDDGWYSNFATVAKILGCLQSSFVDGNEHVFRKARELAANALVPDDVAKDAERYRFIASSDALGIACMFARKIDECTVGLESMYCGEKLDAAIDAAILAAKEKG